MLRGDDILRNIYDELKTDEIKCGLLGKESAQACLKLSKELCLPGPMLIWNLDLTDYLGGRAQKGSHSPASPYFSRLL